MALGASSLSDAQLIAAILRTGTKGIDATKLAEEIIKMCGRFDTNDNDSLIGLANLSIPELMCRYSAYVNWQEELQKRQQL